MKIGYFTERPYQDPDLMAGRIDMADLIMSNGRYDPMLGADLYNRYLDEKIYAEEMGFDMLMLNEHHSTPFCMGGVMNVEASILARETSKAKIVLLGNVIPIWDDPVVAGRDAGDDRPDLAGAAGVWLGSGHRARVGVAQRPSHRSTGSGSRKPTTSCVKAWTTAGPFRWEGKHYQYRYVNPWMRPYQQPHPPVWVPGVLSARTPSSGAPGTASPTSCWPPSSNPPSGHSSFTTRWPKRPVTKQVRSTAATSSRCTSTRPRTRPTTPDASSSRVRTTSSSRAAGPGPNPFIQNLPGLTCRTQILPTGELFQVLLSRGRVKGPLIQTEEDDAKEQTPEEVEAGRVKIYESQLENYTIITGTPETVLPKIRHVLETLRPGQIFFWDGDGAMSHEDAMRSLKLMGEEVIPAVREMGRELELPDAFEINPANNEPISAVPAASGESSTPATSSGST